MSAAIVLSGMLEGFAERLAASIRSLEHAEIPGPFTVILAPSQYDDLMASDDEEAKGLLNGMLVHVENVRFVTTTAPLLRIYDDVSEKPPSIGTWKPPRGKRKGTRFPRAPRRLTK